MNTQQPTVSEPNSMGGMNTEEKALIEPKLGDRVRFTGTLDYDKVQLDALSDVIEATKAALNAEEDTA